MSRIDDVLELQNLDPDARKELQDAKKAVKDLEALASLAHSVGGQELCNILKDDCRDILTQMINTKIMGAEGWQDKVINSLLPDFQAKFTLYNTIKSAEVDYRDSVEALNARVEEILEG